MARNRTPYSQMSSYGHTGQARSLLTSSIKFSLSWQGSNVAHPASFKNIFELDSLPGNPRFPVPSYTGGSGLPPLPSLSPGSIPAISTNKNSPRGGLFLFVLMAGIEPATLAL
jgi:hypothetical protein